MTATGPSALNEEDRTLLLLSVAQYLQKNGFSKTLKKLRSEAQLEEDGWKGPKLDLEEMCTKFLDKGNNPPIHSSGLGQDGKKKKSEENSKNLVADNSGDADRSVHENDNIKEKKKKAKRSSETLTEGRQELRPGETKEPGGDVVNELPQNKDDKKQKDKKKKNLQSVPEPLSNKENLQVEVMTEQATGGKSEEVTACKQKDDDCCEVKKSKDKKQKKSKSTSNEIANEAEEEQNREKSKSMKEDANRAVSERETITSEVEKENKPQKRKRLGSEDNDSGQTDKESLEQSKRRKKEHKESIASEQKSDVKASPNGEVDLLESKKTPSKQDGNENGNIIKTVEKSTAGKDMKRQRNGSAEPKSTTAKAFQRVKVNEVVFADEKLKDNSYWAKDGAEIGYGAKAQEVLGQVRGRDFRHEKTKKKRGSYRGGQIDLHSHSVKFNYSDDE